MIIRVLIFVVLIYLVYRLFKGVFRSSREIEGRDGAVIDEMVQDPYCKTYVPRRDSVKRVIEGREYSFCGKECADKFEAARKQEAGTS